jgi:hypothetical protein
VGLSLVLFAPHFFLPKSVLTVFHTRTLGGGLIGALLLEDKELVKSLIPKNELTSKISQTNTSVNPVHNAHGRSPLSD